MSPGPSPASRPGHTAWLARGSSNRIQGNPGEPRRGSPEQGSGPRSCQGPFQRFTGACSMDIAGEPSALQQQTELEEEVAALIAEAVNLDKPAQELDPDVPPFRRRPGPGLDRRAGDRAGGLEEVRFSAALRRPCQPAHLRLAALVERAHRAASHPVVLSWRGSARSRSQCVARIRCSTMRRRCSTSRAGRRSASRSSPGCLRSGWLEPGLAAVARRRRTLALSLWVAGRFPGLLLYTPPLVINLGLCALFARTLRRGQRAAGEPFCPHRRAAVSWRPISRAIRATSPRRGPASSC